MDAGDLLVGGDGERSAGRAARAASSPINAAPGCRRSQSIRAVLAGERAHATAGCGCSLAISAGRSLGGDDGLPLVGIEQRELQHLVHVIDEVEGQVRR